MCGSSDMLLFQFREIEFLKKETAQRCALEESEASHKEETEKLQDKVVEEAQVKNRGRCVREEWVCVCVCFRLLLLHQCPQASQHKYTFRQVFSEVFLRSHNH